MPISGLANSGFINQSYLEFYKSKLLARRHYGKLIKFSTFHL
jgi:hypothetical protein